MDGKYKEYFEDFVRESVRIGVGFGVLEGVLLGRYGIDGLELCLYGAYCVGLVIVMDLE